MNILQSNKSGSAYTIKLNKRNTFLERNVSYNELNLCCSSSVLMPPIDRVLLTMLSKLMCIVPEITEKENKPSQRDHRKTLACTQAHMCVNFKTHTSWESLTLITDFSYCCVWHNASSWAPKYILSDTEGKQLFSNCQSYFH